MQHSPRHVVRLAAAAATAALCAGATSVLAGAGPLEDPIPGGIASSPVFVRLVPVASALTAPNWGIDAPGHPGRLIVTDQSGLLRAVDLATGDVSTFLDASPVLVPLGAFGPGTFDERGLLGVAFHPDYLTNGHVYTYTSEPASGTPDFSTMPRGMAPNHHATISEWTVPNPADAASVVDPDSRRVLLTVAEPQFNHNAGAVAFGPDGMLYIAFGDGGGADDVDGQPFIGAPMVGHGDGNGKDPTNPLGAILRIDPLGTNSTNGQYGIPADNPFVGQAPILEEIFAYGFRNPFRMSFDRDTGALYVGDVGQNDIEEVDVVVAGGNYGWNHKEGSFFFDPNGTKAGFVTDVDPGVPADLIDPIAEYDHDEGISVIGGFVYRGRRLPALEGRYVFGEFALTFSNDGRLFHLGDDDEILEFNLVGQDGVGMSVLGFGQDAGGELYLFANTTGTPFEETGVMFRIAPIDGDLDADGDVDPSDLAALLAAWNTGPDAAADLDGDGIVGPSDLAILLANWS